MPYQTVNPFNGELLRSFDHCLFFVLGWKNERDRAEELTPYQAGRRKLGIGWINWLVLRRSYVTWLRMRWDRSARQAVFNAAFPIQEERQ